MRNPDQPPEESNLPAHGCQGRKFSPDSWHPTTAPPHKLGLGHGYHEKRPQDGRKSARALDTAGERRHNRPVEVVGPDRLQADGRGEVNCLRNSLSIRSSAHREAACRGRRLKAGASCASGDRSCLPLRRVSPLGMRSSRFASIEIDPSGPPNLLDRCAGNEKRALIPIVTRRVLPRFGTSTPTVPGRIGESSSSYPLSS